MTHRIAWHVPAIMIVASACNTTLNTLPAPVSPTAAVQYYDLDLPADLEVRSVDFTASAYSEASGGPDLHSSEVGGRAFVKVYAVRRGTGEQLLLLYEDIAHRRRPVQVIRFHPSAPDSTR